MDVDQLLICKRELQKNIQTSINEFENITGCYVDEISLVHGRDMDTGRTTTIIVQAEVKL